MSLFLIKKNHKNAGLWNYYVALESLNGHPPIIPLITGITFIRRTSVTYYKCQI